MEKHFCDICGKPIDLYDGYTLYQHSGFGGVYIENRTDTQFNFSAELCTTCAERIAIQLGKKPEPTYSKILHMIRRQL